MAHADNQVKIADGRITLYQRDDVKDGQWQCRMSVKGHKGYPARSDFGSEAEAPDAPHSNNLTGLFSNRRIRRRLLAIKR